MDSFSIDPRYPSALRRGCLTLVLFTLAAACGGSHDAGPAPELSFTSPADADTDVALNTKLSASFDMPMAQLSEASFTLKQGNTPVAGTVATSADGLTATFAPSSDVAAATVYTATISTGATSTAGIALAADRSWSFTTGAAADATAPAVTSPNPAAGAAGVPLNAAVSTSFTKAMDPLTITSSTFTLKQGAVQVAGSVTYGPGTTATFTPASSLTASTLFTAGIGAGAKDLAGNALAAFSWTFTTGTTAVPVQVPTVTSTFPFDAATAVGLNAKLSASFDMQMFPLNAAHFTLKHGTAQVSGTVATSANGQTATFAPSGGLAANTLYTATVAAGAKSAAGTVTAADTSWTFTTGAVADTTAPTVTVTNPVAAATGVLTNTKIAATFSEAMDPLSIGSTTFTVKQGTVQVAGSVAYGPGTTATFTAANPFTASTVFTATLSTGVKDLAGNALSSAFTWTFTTGTVAAKGPSPVGLGQSGNFVIVAKTGISTVPASAVTGDIAVSPAAASFITGFSLVADATNVFSSSTQLTGKAFAANYAVPTPINLTTAVSDMQTAYTDAAGRPTPDFLELGTGNLGGKTLAPGLYKWTSTVNVPTDVTISGGANDVWIFQTTGDLIMAANMHVTLAGGALAKNIFWQVAGQSTFGAGAHFEGVLLCKTGVTLQTGSTMNGRILAQTAVALQKATVTKPAP
jgi:hypothetical protein